MAAEREPALCGECGAIHRPGENTLCPGWRPGPFIADEPTVDFHGIARISVKGLKLLLAKHGLHLVTDADLEVLKAAYAFGDGEFAQIGGYNFLCHNEKEDTLCKAIYRRNTELSRRDGSGETRPLEKPSPPSREPLCFDQDGIACAAPQFCECGPCLRASLGDKP